MVADRDGSNCNRLPSTTTSRVFYDSLFIDNLVGTLPLSQRCRYTPALQVKQVAAADSFATVLPWARRRLLDASVCHIPMTSASGSLNFSFRDSTRYYERRVRRQARRFVHSPLQFSRCSRPRIAMSPWGPAMRVPHKFLQRA